jgi:hypothetical protein
MDSEGQQVDKSDAGDPTLGKPGTGDPTLTIVRETVKSAFKWIYLLIFLYATYTVAVGLTPELLKSIKSGGEIDDQLFAGALIVVLIGGILLHSIRVYFTFEMVEHRHPLFDHLLGQLHSSGTRIRTLEFVFRFCIISIVTYKAWGSLADFGGVCAYLKLLYGALLLWSLLVFLFVLEYNVLTDWAGIRANWKSILNHWNASYGWIAVFGFVFAWILEWAGPPTPNRVAPALVSAGFITPIWINLWRDFRKNRRAYWGFFQAHYFFWR